MKQNVINGYRAGGRAPNRHNERIKERGKSVGYAGGKKWREKSEWIITENTHQPLIGIDTAECIRRVKAQGLRDTPFNKQAYPLSGTLICSVCGTSYTGDKGIYRCNSKSKPGHEYPNNGISRETVESAVFGFIGQKFLNFQNVRGAIEEAKRKLGQDTIGLKSIDARLNRIQAERERMMDLYRRGLADDQNIEKVLQNLNERRAYFESEIHRIKAIHGVESDRSLKRCSPQSAGSAPPDMRVCFPRRGRRAACDHSKGS